jgi:predicted RNA-binding Zn ribbon-like protein
MSVSTDRAPASVPAIRVGDHLALDFLNSIASPQGEELEWIPDGPALLQWLEDSGKIQPDEHSAALKACLKAELDNVAEEARELREWFRRLLIRLKERGTSAISQRDIDKLNNNLAAGTFSRHLERGKDSRLGLVWKNDSSGGRMFLAPLAEAIAELLCEEDLGLVSKCGGPGCTLWFCDRTKSHHRRWCSQAVCGNRVRVNAFRQRNRTSL